MRKAPTTVHEYVMALHVRVDSEGYLVIDGTVPGLHLASCDHSAVWRDLGRALPILLRQNEGWPPSEQEKPE